MAETDSKRQWFRFSLRTLLAVVTLAAVGVWVWTSMPLWLKGREQLDFERSARQIKAGMKLSDEKLLLSKQRDYYSSSDTSYRPILLARYDWPNAIYCVYYVLDQSPIKDPSDRRIESVQIFRIPAVPDGYQPRTLAGKRSIDRHVPPLKPEQKPIAGYMADFLDFLNGDRKNNPGFGYELIYSDPPTKSIK